MDRILLTLMIKQAALGVNKDSAAEFRLDAQGQKERDHVETLSEKSYCLLMQMRRLYLSRPAAKVVVI